MATAQSFTLHHSQAFPESKDLDLKTANCVQCHVGYFKGRGYYASIQPGEQNGPCVSVVLDFSGKYRFPLLQAKRFNGNILILYRSKFMEALPGLAADLAAHGPDYIRKRVEAMA